MEEEAKKSEQTLADTVTKLAVSSKDADTIMKAVKVVESKCMNNEVTIEELDKNLRATIKMAHDNEQKLDELSRKLGVQESELKRGLERAELAEKNLKVSMRGEARGAGGTRTIKLLFCEDNSFSNHQSLPMCYCFSI
jgi:uncharacterized membrane protein